jgi:hypothetical protein
MDVNTALWWPITILGLLAALCIEAMRRLSFKKGGELLEGALSALGVLFALGAGRFVPRTFVGQDMIPALVGFEPQTMKILVSAVAFIGVCAGVLAFIPGRWSSTVAVGPAIVVMVALIPATLAHSYGGGAMDAVRWVVDLASTPAGALTDWALN